MPELESNPLRGVNLVEEGDEYDDFNRWLRHRLRKWSATEQAKKSAWREPLLILPDIFQTIVKVMLDPRVSVAEKGPLGLAVAYVVSPVDLLPEALLGPIGYVDDLTVAAYALNRLRDTPSADIVAEHWSGYGAIYDWVLRVIDLADRKLESETLVRIRGLFEPVP